MKGDDDPDGSELSGRHGSPILFIVAVLGIRRLHSAPYKAQRWMQFAVPEKVRGEVNMGKKKKKNK